MSQTSPPRQYRDQDELHKGYDPLVAQRLAGYITPYRRQFILSLFMMMTGSMATVAGPYIIRYALDSGLAVGSISAIQQSVFHRLWTEPGLQAA